MNNYIWISWIICSCFLSGCKEKWQRDLEDADKSLLYHNDYEGWQLVREDNSSKWDTKYTIKKDDNDTTKILFFLKSKGGLIEINEYKKRYPCNGVDTCNLEMTSQDTMFFYRQHNDKKLFEIGEYTYRFTYFKMDSTESSYYLKHEDSLRRIRGNNLPKLPKE